jgi:tRNA(Ile2) C34 agmatinyltransferase TiaS
VAATTQNCVSTVLEFACVSKVAKEELLQSIRAALIKYSVSKDTGMAVLSDFDATGVQEYSTKCRSGELNREYALEYAKKHGVEAWIDGNGIIGALAALSWFARPDESVRPDAKLEQIEHD